MTISIVFRVPVVDLTKSEDQGPYMCFRASDSEVPERWRGCGHKHVFKHTAQKCARSMSLGQVFGAVNERIEIRSKV